MQRAVTKRRVPERWAPSPARFGLLQLCRPALSARWNQDLTVKAHDDAIQLFSITGESSSLQIYF